MKINEQLDEFNQHRNIQKLKIKIKIKQKMIFRNLFPNEQKINNLIKIIQRKGFYIYLGFDIYMHTVTNFSFQHVHQPAWVSRYVVYLLSYPVGNLSDCIIVVVPIYCY